MVKQIFVNLAVKDLDRAKAFFAALGFGFDARFTDGNAACLVLGENIFAMLLLERFFKTFVRKEIADATRSTEAIMGLACGSRAEVDAMAARALASGASPANDPYDYGWMYGKSFHDPDGHFWEAFWMDPAQRPPAA